MIIHVRDNCSLVGACPNTIDKPVLIYGNMQYAANVYDFCVKSNFQVEGFVVDKEYWSDKQNLCGYKVQPIENYIDRIEDFDLLIGFCNAQKTRMLLGNEALLRCNVYLIHFEEGMWRWTEPYIKENESKFKTLRETLADSKSRQTLDALINVKTGTGKFEELISVSEDEQYFNKLTFEISPKKEIYVDCGAFNGDTVVKYSKFVDGSYKKIFALEPMKDNLEMLKDACKSVHDVTIFPVGAYKEHGTLFFEENGSESKAVETVSENSINVDSLDNLLGDEKITFIKMDIEGSECQALLGAKRIIEQHFTTFRLQTIAL